MAEGYQPTSSAFQFLGQVVWVRNLFTRSFYETLPVRVPFTIASVNVQIRLLALMLALLLLLVAIKFFVAARSALGCGRKVTASGAPGNILGALMVL